ncbi:MAG: nuclear transport factor 2 family protein [Opitutaceae bacterium]|nr:nuclear transport factor 2 family protein [Opitutaceae bacterium]
MNRSLRFLPVLASLLLLCLPKTADGADSGQSARKEALKAELARMEDAFCAMTKEKGIQAAFEFFAAPDVAFIDTDPRRFRGIAAVRERMGPEQPGVSVTWSALFTDVSDDGTLGYNWGRYEWRIPGADGRTIVRTGYFLTIWKRQSDGSWRYVMDSGAPDRTAPAPKPDDQKRP